MSRFSRRHVRGLLVAVFAICAAAISAGFAFAYGGAPPAGTGVVLVDTNLGYQDGQAAGTGMVLASSGRVLTNNHVIAGATTIRVTVPGTHRTYPATVVGYSVQKDVAVLQLKHASNLETVSTAGSSKLRVGQTVTAVGNTLGEGTLTTARGVITGLGKTITAGDEQGRSEQLNGLIETNANVQPGDSGGPLLDVSHHVIGMNTAATTGFGVGFQDARSSNAYAIPIGQALGVAKLIVAGTSSATVHVGGTAFLGVEVESPASLGPGPSGALIAGVVAGGPADSAGLVPGDLITAVDGKTIASPRSLTGVVTSSKPGTTVQVTFADQSGSHTVPVTLGSGPPQ